MLCRSCYTEIPAGSAFCARCGALQGEAPAVGPARPVAAPVAATEAVAPDNPWEVREGRSVLEAFGETLQRSLLQPARFFRGTDPGGSVAPALRYAAAIGTISLVVMALWQAALASVLGGGQTLMPGPQRGWSGFLFLLPLIPVSIVLWSFAAAAVLHLSLLVLRGARGGYGATLKAVCYASSGMALYAVPGIGVPAGTVWQLVLSIVGLRELHRTCCTARAVLAYLLPVFVGVALLAAVGIIAALAGIGAFMHLLQRGFEI